MHGVCALDAVYAWFGRSLIAHNKRNKISARALVYVAPVFCYLLMCYLSWFSLVSWLTFLRSCGLKADGSNLGRNAMNKRRFTLMFQCERFEQCGSSHFDRLGDRRLVFRALVVPSFSFSFVSPSLVLLPFFLPP